MVGGEDGRWENRKFVIEGRDDKIKIREFKLGGGAECNQKRNQAKKTRSTAEIGLAPFCTVAGKSRGERKEVESLLPVRFLPSLQFLVLAPGASGHNEPVVIHDCPRMTCMEYQHIISAQRFEGVLHTSTVAHLPAMSVTKAQVDSAVALNGSLVPDSDWRCVCGIEDRVGRGGSNSVVSWTMVVRCPSRNKQTAAEANVAFPLLFYSCCCTRPILLPSMVSMAVGR